MKKPIALILTLIVMVSVFSTAQAAEPSIDNFKFLRSYSNRFTDVYESQWFYAAMKRGYEIGLIDGLSETTFSPNSNVSLAQILALASRLHSIYYTGEASFVQGTPWYQVYVDYADKNGFLLPNLGNYSRAAKRGEVAGILAKALSPSCLPPINIVENDSLPDVKMNSQYAAEIYTLYRAGVLTGNDAKGTFAPNSEILRSEIAAIISRMAIPGSRISKTFDNATGQNNKIGVSMPTQYLHRWYEAGHYLKQEFEALGYEVDLQFGGYNEVPVQIAQIENMISGGCDVLVIMAIDAGSMAPVLNDAKSKGVKVVAYDRLIRGTDAVDYYVTFSNWQVGVEQGLAIESALDLKNALEPFNIEFFTGDPGDNNINYFYGGAMEILKPYLDSGKLVCRSGQTDIMQVTTESWKTDNAIARMENLIASNNYVPGKTPLHAVMCSNDSTAQGVTVALLNAGFTAGPGFPVITGQDCDILSVKNIIAGTQFMSVFKDPGIIGWRVVTMVGQILSGAAVETNAKYNNGVRDVPTYDCELLLCTKDNYRAILIDGGYFTEADLLY